MLFLRKSISLAGISIRRVELFFRLLALLIGGNITDYFLVDALLFGLGDFLGFGDLVPMGDLGLIRSLLILFGVSIYCD